MDTRVGTYDDREMRMYVNGVAVARTVAVDRKLANVHQPMAIGSNGDPSTPSFGGYLDEVGVWRTALTSEEIKVLSTGIVPRSGALVAFRRFDRGIEARGVSVEAVSIPPLTFLESAAAGDTRALSDFLDKGLTMRAHRLPYGFAISSLDEQRLLDEALWWAIQRDRVKAGRALADAGADVNARVGPGGATSLHVAVALKRFETVQLALQLGADPNIRDLTHRSTAWGWAGHFDLPVLKAYLLNKAAETDLHAAIEYGDLGRVRGHLKALSPVEAELGRGLRRAVAGGHLEIAQTLIEVGASAQAEFRTNRDPVRSAARNSCYEMVDFLRQVRCEGTDPSFIDWVSSLDKAVEACDATTTGKLLDADPALALCDSESGKTWLQRVGDVDDPRLVSLFLEAGASLDRVKDGHVALSYAVSIGSLRVSAALVAAGARLDMWMAAGLGREQLLPSFWEDDALVVSASSTGSLRRGTDGTVLPRPPTLPVEIVSDALYIAARNGHIEVVRYLLKRGGRPNFKTERGGTLLYWAVKEGHVGVVRRLAAAGGDPRIPDRYGRNALQIAASSPSLMEALGHPGESSDD